MKQVLQNLQTGLVEVVDMVPPTIHSTALLVETGASLISAGTERATVQLAKKSLLGKAKDRPDLVRKVLRKAQREGWAAAFQSVKHRISQDLALGYSSAGRVVAVGETCTQFQPGQVVSCAGAGHANHAEYNVVPMRLASLVPTDVDVEAASYAAVGAVALHGLHTANYQPGMSVAVVGLGLVGQLAVQLAQAGGCRVAGFDPDGWKRDLALAGGAVGAFAADEVSQRAAIAEVTRGRGFDIALITASSSNSAPVSAAAALARDRGHIVLVGATGMELSRRIFYEKELTFTVSRSYGPGRHDPSYEKRGNDYPLSYVRWTIARNMECFLDSVAAGRVRPQLCTTHRIAIENAGEAYSMLLDPASRHLGIVLTYGHQQAYPRLRSTEPSVKASSRSFVGRAPALSLLGGGAFAASTLLPLFRAAGVHFVAAASGTGAAARTAARLFSFTESAQSVEEVIASSSSDAVIVTTPHSLHAPIAKRVVESGKCAFVEKPLAVSLPQLRDLLQLDDQARARIMVGFNRRFSPAAIRLASFFRSRRPLVINYRVNAGSLVDEHWLLDPAEGGRFVGEACHFIDLASFLIGSPIASVHAMRHRGREEDANVVAHFLYEDGSLLDLTYTHAGDGIANKERIEVHAAGATAVVEDFRTLVISEQGKRVQAERWRSANKGHGEEVAGFLAALKEGLPMPIAFASACETTLATLAAVHSTREGRTIYLDSLWRELM